MNRKEILKKAYEEIFTGSHVYMCNAIERYLGEKEKVFKVFPEILKYKPINKSKDSAWWYNDDEGKHKRLAVLKQLIEEIND